MGFRLERPWEVIEILILDIRIINYIRLTRFKSVGDLFYSILFISFETVVPGKINA